MQISDQPLNLPQPLPASREGRRPPIQSGGDGVGHYSKSNVMNDQYRPS
jgi:hypothetical protein